MYAITGLNPAYLVNCRVDVLLNFDCFWGDFFMAKVILFGSIFMCLTTLIYESWITLATILF